jgi:hypothetical protein
LARVGWRAGLGNGRVCGVGGGVFNDAIISKVRDIEVAAGVNRDAGRSAQVVLSWGVDVARGFVAQAVKHIDLADYQICSLPVRK